MKRTSEKSQKTSPIALIINTVPIDINTCSLVVLVFVCIIYSACL